MGYFGKVELQLQAVKLRKKGLSIRDIEKTLHISRASASTWTKGVELTKKQIDTLYKGKISGGLKGSFIASQNKINKKIKK